MNKSTKLILAAVGLGGLAYLLYKKGVFANKKTATQVAKEVAKEVVKKVEEVVQPVENTYVEPQPSPPPPQPTVIYSPDVEYPKEGKLAEVVYTQTSFEPSTYDQPNVEDRIVKIDYTSDKYSYGVETEYAEKDLDFIRNNRELFY